MVVEARVHEKESMYYIEDGVTVELMTGDDELVPIVLQRGKDKS